MNAGLRRLISANLIGSAFAGFAAVASTMRIAMINPLSGLFTVLGGNQFKIWQKAAAKVNKEEWANVHMFEFVTIENKNSSKWSVQKPMTRKSYGTTGPRPIRYILSGGIRHSVKQAGVKLGVAGGMVAAPLPEGA